MVTIITCTNKEDTFKTEGARVATTFLPLSVYVDFFRRSSAANLVDRVEIRTHPSFYGFPPYLQECRSDQKSKRKSGHKIIHQFLDTQGK